jgi:hypothetical protein
MDLMYRLLRLFVCFALLSLVGCSSTFRTYTQTLELAFNPGEGAILTKAEVAARDSDVLYAKVGSLPNAILVLAFSSGFCNNSIVNPVSSSTSLIAAS